MSVYLNEPLFCRIAFTPSGIPLLPHGAQSTSESPDLLALVAANDSTHTQNGDNAPKQCAPARRQRKRFHSIALS